MRKFFVVGSIVLLSFSLTSNTFAEENKERSLTGFFRRLFNYPVKAVKETGEMTGHTLSNAGEKVVSKTGENASYVVQGDLGKTGNLVVEPVAGAAQTTGQAVSETVQVPVKAAQEEESTATQGDTQKAGT